MSTKLVETEREKQAALKIRKLVFVEEQNVPAHLEVDEFEDEAIHFICNNNEQTIGASRLRFIDQYGKLERICVLKSHRGQSFGKEIIEKMEEEITKKGYTKAKLNAQSYAKEFYEQLGYEVISKEFIDAGIPHVTMVKNLTR